MPEYHTFVNDQKRFHQAIDQFCQSAVMEIHRQNLVASFVNKILFGRIFVPQARSQQTEQRQRIPKSPNPKPEA